MNIGKFLKILAAILIAALVLAALFSEPVADPDDEPSDIAISFSCPVAGGCTQI